MKEASFVLVLGVIVAGLYFSLARTEVTGIMFEEIAAASGVTFEHQRREGQEYVNLGGGAAIGDYDNDGDLDLYVTNSNGANALYNNNGSERFTDVASTSGVADVESESNGAAWADYDNDGDLDLYVANWGTSKLFRNDGERGFEDVTTFAGVADARSEYRTMGATWGDYDRDGHVDLLVVRYIWDVAGIANRTMVQIDVPMGLYHNRGDGTFEEVTALLRNPSRYPDITKSDGFTPAFVDYDNDGDQDIYVANDHGAIHVPNVMWRNDGAGENGTWIFTDVSEVSGTGIPMYGMGIAVGDYDNDLDVDLYVTNMGPSVFLENNGDGTFGDVSSRSGTQRAHVPGFVKDSQEDFSDPDFDSNNFDMAEDDMSFGWGAVFADLDNDTLLDLYYVAGQIDNYSDLKSNPLRQPNAVFRNMGDGTFADVSTGSFADDDGIGREVQFADFDNDGRVDLLVTNLGRIGLLSRDDLPAKLKLFRNVTQNDHHWLGLKLIGTASNRDGLGARVTVTADGKRYIREMGASQGHISHSVVPLHFGLGGSKRVERIEIAWPSGRVQTIEHVKADRLLSVTEE